MKSEKKIFNGTLWEKVIVPFEILNNKRIGICMNALIILIPVQFSINFELRSSIFELFHPIFQDIWSKLIDKFFANNRNHYVLLVVLSLK